MTFAQKITRLNERHPEANFHIFGMYDDGTRDYFGSRVSKEAAINYAAMLDGGIVYDREGNDVE